MILPNFIIIGAARAGTTSIYQYLCEHPQVFMSPIKETNFFAVDWQKNGDHTGVPDSIKTIEDYAALFQKATPKKAVGEASPWYFSAPEAPLQIRQYVPAAKLIVVLRDPADRAHSMYMKYVRDGNERCANILEAILDTDSSVRHSEGLYITPGFYYKHLQRYLEVFDKNQIRIFLYEDLCCDAAAFMSRIFDFIGVESSFKPQNMELKYNISGVPKNNRYKLITKLNPVWRACQAFIPNAIRYEISRKVMNMKRNNLKQSELLPEERSRLIAIYRNDLLKLQNFLKRDLSAWLN